MLRIGTKTEKESVEQELKELRERLSRADEWRQRRDEIVEELNKVWTVQDDDGAGEETLELKAPRYQQSVEAA